MYLENIVWDELNITNVIKQEDIMHGSLDPVQGGRKVLLLLHPERFEKGKVYHIAMKVYDDQNMSSGVSNIGQIVRLDRVEDTSMSGSDIAGIFFGCVYLLGAFLIVVGYLIYQKFV